MKIFSKQILSGLEAKQKYAAFDLDVFKYRKDTDFDASEKVLVFTESIEIESLYLDSEDFTFNYLLNNPETDYILTIIIEGDLTVKEDISNYETDGSIGVVVLGNVTAKNILVGGHQFYVSGNLTVQEIVCGSYNHGSMYIKGNATAKYFIPDDFKIFVGGITQGSIVGEEIYYFDSKNENENYYGEPILPTKILDEVLNDKFIDEEYNIIKFNVLIDAVREKESIYTVNIPFYVLYKMEPLDSFSWEQTYLAVQNIKMAIWSYPQTLFIPVINDETNVKLYRYNGLNQFFYYEITRAAIDENQKPLHQNASLYLIDTIKNEKYFIELDFLNEDEMPPFYYGTEEELIKIDKSDFVRLKGLQNAFTNYFEIMNAELEIQQLFDYQFIESLRQELLLFLKDANGFQNGYNYIGTTNQEDGSTLLWISHDDVDTIYFELKDNFVTIYYQPYYSDVLNVVSIYETGIINKAKKYLDKASMAIDNFVIEINNTSQND